MSDAPDHTRRWLINASGAAILSNAVPVTATYAQTAAAAPPNARPESHGDPSTISPVTTALADYVAKTLDRELPAAALARTKLHVLDTIAAMVSGSRLKPGDFAAPVLGTARANELIAAVNNLDRFGPVSGLRRLLQA